MNPRLIALTGDVGIAEQLQDHFRFVDKQRLMRDGLGLLTIADSLNRTEEFRAFHPVVRDLEGVIIDDPGTSDHHVVLCRAPFGGAVLHLAHDGESRIVFDSVDSFIKAVQRAFEIGGYVYDQHPDHAWIAADQATLRELISSLSSEPDKDIILPILIPSLDLSDLDFLTTLVTNEDMYVAEAVCREIASRPSPLLLPIAALGEEHSHPMARDAAARARVNIAGEPAFSPTTAIAG